ncbi:MAG: 3-isopropylmalate dehydrogenase [Candidatus Lambdaproteobacteria bacterium RIFOXYD1_FULL_56_27]|uniref:3-isopropylmalate dehydrogenase n=1 Tax=Candidatus Lambdaproteobacteria bacterium RIFOXYD2_FULL_56_26 TaxID=1817773 RepID=A0A1F6H289_9PROT|nr:MAG: 3-isopropylmalate dehydrogenase [Candidatus Lambdaproteobacteria bacterium RIFOXYC1_FULL_56_13]OGH04503.1 MAG: 3-isopropylmalate dehydrogenase [Candidatus Lambdaproteobacteria bacterium RIFOXYD2_FULL_56_26]OGH08335.1 MAG: 3-isopropylmalate dehydrogenase [Candidatus Lambdaproteobacteria bacterium RIFOXYD1_FULL_56_27]
MKQYKIALLPGDGIGPEIMKEAVKVLKLVQERNPVAFELNEVPFGAVAYFATGDAFPEATKLACDQADAVLKGTIGLSHEESKKIPVDKQPERGALLPLRKRLNTYANFRPVYLPKELAHFSPLRPEVVGEGIDLMIIRELVGGLYFGQKERGIKNGKRFVNEMLEYDEDQIRQILIVGFETAKKRRKLLHNIHKSNVLLSSVLWNEILEEVAPSYPEVEVRHMLVDAAATALCLNPCQFDVMVMENMFGDILSDQGGGILGSLGLMPSACMGPNRKAYYEPSHGSAPDIAGQGIANPYSMIGSVAMMLDMSFGLTEEAQNLWGAMKSVFAAGFTTPDLKRGGDKLISTAAFGDKVLEALAKSPKPKV